jgi:hypothetical protein
MSLTSVPSQSLNAKSGERVELARYELPDGERTLMGQRIGGRVAVIDSPAGPEGRVYLVERAVASEAELEGLVAEYRERSEAAGNAGSEASRENLRGVPERRPLDGRATRPMPTSSVTSATTDLTSERRSTASAAGLRQGETAKTSRS